MVQMDRADLLRNADRAVRHNKAYPADPHPRTGRADHNHNETNPADHRPRAGPAAKVARLPVTSTTPAAKAVDPTDHRRATSVDPTTMTGGHPGIQEITTGADGSTVRRGGTGFRRGAGVHRRRLSGMGRCPRRGDRLRRRSTTGAFRSSRCGTPVSTSGASGSSESGFRCRSDLSLALIHLSE